MLPGSYHEGEWHAADFTLGVSHRFRLLDAFDTLRAKQGAHRWWARPRVSGTALLLCGGLARKKRDQAQPGARSHLVKERVRRS